MQSHEKEFISPQAANQNLTPNHVPYLRLCVYTYYNSKQSMNDNQPTSLLRPRLPLRHSYMNRKRSAEDALVELMSPLNGASMLTSDCSNSSRSESERSSPSNNNSHNEEEEEELRPSAFKGKHSASSFATPPRHNSSNNSMQLMGSSSIHSNGKFNSAFASSVSVDHLSSPVTPNCSAQMLHLSLNSPQPQSQKRVPLKVLTNSGGKRVETPPTKLFAFSPLPLLSKQPCCSNECEEMAVPTEHSVKESVSCCSTDMSTEGSVLKPHRLCMNGGSSLVSTDFTKEHVTPLVSNRRKPKSVTDEEVKQSNAYLPNLTRSEGSISLLEAFDCEFDSKGFDVHSTPEDDFFLSSPSKITSLSPSKVMKRAHEHYASGYQKPLNDVPINEYGSSYTNSTFGRSESVTSSLTCYSHNSLVDFAAGNKVAQE